MSEVKFSNLTGVLSTGVNDSDVLLMSQPSVAPDTFVKVAVSDLRKAIGAGSAVPEFYGPPPASTFGTLAGGDSPALTVGAVTRGLIFSCKQNSGDSNNVATMPYPSNPFTLYARIKKSLILTNYFGCAIAIGSASGQYYLLNNSSSGGTPLAQWANWNSLTSYNSSPFSSTRDGEFEYFKVVDDGTNITFYVGVDPDTWTELGQQARSSFLTGGPTTLGVGIMAHTSNMTADGMLQANILAWAIIEGVNEPPPAEIIAQGGTENPSTVGFAQVTGFTNFGGGNYGLARIYPPEDITISKICVLTGAATQGADLVPCVYADNNGAASGALLGTGPTLPNTIQGLNEIELTDPVTLEAGTPYWIGVMVTGNGINIAQSSSNNSGYTGTGGATTVPNPGPGTGSGDSYLFYAAA